MIQSSKPRKQRLFRYTAPMHIRQHFMHAHLDKELRAKLGITQRTVQISRGDTVKVMSGSRKGSTGKVTLVNLRTGRVCVDSLMRKNARGKEFNIGISVSNVYITALNLTDKFRAAKLKLAQQVEEKKTVKAEAVQKPEAAEKAATESAKAVGATTAKV